MLYRHVGIPGSRPGQGLSGFIQQAGREILQQAGVRQAANSIPVRCASTMSSAVDFSSNNVGECNTLTKLSDLSSSLEQSIRIIREQSKCQSGSP